MIRNRFFMFGLGVGLIAGALLLQLMISGRAAPLTKEQLIKEAAKLNLTVVDNAKATDEEKLIPGKRRQRKVLQQRHQGPPRYLRMRLRLLLRLRRPRLRQQLSQVLQPHPASRQSLYSRRAAQQQLGLQLQRVRKRRPL